MASSLNELSIEEVRIAAGKMASATIAALLPVHAQPGASKEGILGIHAGRLKVAVHAAPEKGKANQALIECLARALGVKRSQISLQQGETSSHKKFLFVGISPEELRERIARVLETRRTDGR